uniref:Uncharacterized protein n=1 Tax=Caenorhabditis japonica TaxID=281687 RepID=A0A8R1EQ72_CAEJA
MSSSPPQFAETFCLSVPDQHTQSNDFQQASRTVLVDRSPRRFPNTGPESFECDHWLTRTPFRHYATKRTSARKPTSSTTSIRKHQSWPQETNIHKNSRRTTHLSSSPAHAEQSTPERERQLSNRLINYTYACSKCFASFHIAEAPWSNLAHYINFMSRYQRAVEKATFPSLTTDTPFHFERIRVDPEEKGGGPASPFVHHRRPRSRAPHVVSRLHADRALSPGGLLDHFDRRNYR